MIESICVSYVLQHAAGGNQERLLDLVIEQLVDRAGSYGLRWPQRPGSNIQRGAKQLTDTAENVLKRLCIDTVANLVWGQSAVDAEEVCGETSNMRSSHGRPRDHIGTPVIPSGNDVHARSEDINRGTKIGEGGPCIMDITSTDSDCLLSAGRRVVDCVGIIVPGGYDDCDAAVVKLEVESLVSGVAVTFHPLGAYRFDGLVDAVESTTSQAHRSNRGYAGVQRLLGDPEYPGDTVIR